MATRCNGTGQNWNSMRLDWIGLDWIGLDWIELNWIELNWTGIGREDARFLLMPVHLGSCAVHLRFISICFFVFIRFFATRLLLYFFLPFWSFWNNSRRPLLRPPPLLPPLLPPPASPCLLLPPLFCQSVSLSVCLRVSLLSSSSTELKRR